MNWQKTARNVTRPSGLYIIKLALTDISTSKPEISEPQPGPWVEGFAAVAPMACSRR